MAYFVEEQELKAKLSIQLSQGKSFLKILASIVPEKTLHIHSMLKCQVEKGRNMAKDGRTRAIDLCHYPTLQQFLLLCARMPSL